MEVSIPVNMVYGAVADFFPSHMWLMCGSVPVSRLSLSVKLAIPTLWREMNFKTMFANDELQSS